MYFMIIPDIIRAFEKNYTALIRFPNAIRPWQHVLEPLAGYLTLAADLAADGALSGEAFNFGPPTDQSYSVCELLEQMQLHWVGAVWQDLSEPDAVYEASLLKLCCDKAQHRIAWKPLLTFAENVAMTANWYSTYYDSNVDVWTLTQSQIAQYETLGLERGAVWAE